ncbi:MAG: hypothetical protein ACREYA_27945 [Cupriavidus necator]
MRANETNPMATLSDISALSVLLRELPPPTPEGRMILEFMPGRVEGEKPVASYLSPLDAHIDFTCGDIPKVSYTLRQVALLSVSKLAKTFPNGMVFEIACGFQAVDGKLLADEQGRWRRHSLREAVHASFHDGKQILEVTDGIKRELDYLHEHAGLFAWRETLHYLASDWDQARLDRAVTQAFHTACDVQRSRSGTMNQVALFDFEAEQWHFVPYSPFVESQEDNHLHGE